MSREGVVGMSLSQSEVEFLNTLDLLGGKADSSTIASKMGISESSVFPLSSLLAQKGYVKITEFIKEKFFLTEEGDYCASKGMPETRLMSFLKQKGGQVPLKELSTVLKQNEISPVLGWGKKTGAFSIEKRPDGTQVILKKEVPHYYDSLLSKIKNGSRSFDEKEYSFLRDLISRGLVAKKDQKEIVVELLPSAQRDRRATVSVLTAEDIKSGKWREISLRPYDVSAAPPELKIGKKHPYLEFLEEVKEILFRMGFEETEGQFVETEFWNFDVLFQAQDHPARAVHDSFQVKNISVNIDAPPELIESVRAAHESGGNTGSKGWNYKWDIATAIRPLLRTQMTVNSVRYLHSHKTPPVKAFSLSKVFRPDVIDSRHMVEFCQLDGIVGDKGINVRHLLGILQEFSRQLGFKRIKFRPSYYPFTEPSIDAYVEHPKLGWIECLGAGMFRPEVLSPLGINFPVIAWGIGIDRLAMIRLGINDIRELHSEDLGRLRSWGWW